MIFNSFSSLALKPDSLYQITPDSLNLKYESIKITTPDSFNLQVWKIIPELKVKNNSTIILAYGDSGNMSYWLNQAAILSQRGFSVVLFDYRGFGESSSFDMNPNQLYYNEFAIDLISVIKWVKTEFSENKIGVWALSMGTIMSTIALEQEPLDFFIGEGFVINPTKIKTKIFELKGKEIILPDGHTEIQNKINALTIPMLLFAGSEDIITTIEDSKNIVSQRKNRYIVPFNGGHLQGFQSLTKKYYGDQYILKIERLISKIK
jgi:pimeloyl-ACP methyl ester carboxylesterase